MQIQEASILCPYCGEELEIQLDPSGGNSQSYVEDCQVCCRPINIYVEVSDDGECTVEAQSASS